MSSGGADQDPRFKKALNKLRQYTNMSIPDAMRCADFTSDEVKDRSLQQRVRRAAAKALGDNPTPPTSIDASTMSTMSTLTTTPPSMNLEKKKNVRHKSAAVQQVRRNKLIDKTRKKDATKMATKLYAECQKKEKKLSADVVSRRVMEKTGCRVPPRTIQKHFKEGRVGTSPKKTGPQGHFDDNEMLNLQNAFETYVKIQQLNGKTGNMTPKTLQRLLKQCTSKKKEVDCTWLLRRLLNESGVDLSAGRSNNV